MSVLGTTSRWLMTAAMLLLVLGGTVRAEAPATSQPAVEATPPAAGDNIGSREIQRHGATGKPAEKAAGPSSDSMDSFWRVCVALAIVLGLIFVLKRAGRWMFDLPATGSSSRAISVLSRTTLGPKQQLLLIKVGGRVILVGNSTSQMNTLCEITQAEEVAALVGQVQQEKSGSVSRTFGSLFGKAEEKFQVETNAKKSNGDGEAEVDPSLGTTREELSGLMDKVKGLSSQFKE